MHTEGIYTRTKSDVNTEGHKISHEGTNQVRKNAHGGDIHTKGIYTRRGHTHRGNIRTETYMERIYLRKGSAHEGLYIYLEGHDTWINIHTEEHTPREAYTLRNIHTKET